MVIDRTELHLCITEGVSKTARFLLYQIARAELFKKKHVLILHLTDAKEHFGKLERIVKEFQLSGIPFMKNVSYLNIKEAFAISDILILLHPERGRCGPEPYDYLQPYVEVFKEHGLALALFGKPTARVVVAGDLANTHARVVLEYAFDFPPANVSAVTRLHANYGRAVLADKLQVPVPRVRDVLVTGNCTGVQHIDAMHARLVGGERKQQRLIDQLPHDHFWLRRDFVKVTKDASLATVNVHLPQNALSVAQATFEHVRELWRGTPDGRVSSAGVYVERELAGMRPGIFVSLPVKARGQRWHVDMNLIWELGCMKIKLNDAAEQLHTEAQTAIKILAERKYARENPPRKKSSSLLNVSEVDSWLQELVDKATKSKEDVSSLQSFADKYLGSSNSLGNKKSDMVEGGGSTTSVEKGSKQDLPLGSPLRELGSTGSLKGSKGSAKIILSKTSLKIGSMTEVKPVSSKNVRGAKESFENAGRLPSKASKTSVKIGSRTEVRPVSSKIVRVAKESVKNAGRLPSVTIAGSKEGSAVRASADVIRKPSIRMSKPSMEENLQKKHSATKQRGSK